MFQTKNQSVHFPAGTCDTKHVRCIYKHRHLHVPQLDELPKVTRAAKYTRERSAFVAHAAVQSKALDPYGSIGRDAGVPGSADLGQVAKKLLANNCAAGTVKFFDTVVPKSGLLQGSAEPVHWAFCARRRLALRWAATLLHEGRSLTITTTRSQKFV